MSHHHCHKHCSEAPHESMIGAIIALTVVSIVFQAPFAESTWWAVLVQVILTINMIKEIIIYLTDADARRGYKYATTGDDLLGIWIATIIVSIVMDWIFPWEPWFAQIAPAVLSIKAIEITVLFFVTKAQQNKEKETRHIQTQYHLYGQHASNSRPMIRVVESETKRPIVSNSSLQRELDNYSSIQKSIPNDIPVFCAMCGHKHQEGDKFCSNCGAEL